jgi:hypothetical protein
MIRPSGFTKKIASATWAKSSSNSSSRFRCSTNSPCPCFWSLGGRKESSTFVGSVSIRGSSDRNRTFHRGPNRLITIVSANRKTSPFAASPTTSALMQAWRAVRRKSSEPRARPRPPYPPRRPRRRSVLPSRTARRLRQKCLASSSRAAPANGSCLSAQAR